jgi:maleate isomerase
MYGWRAKLGVILPANNTVAEPELAAAVPTGVSVHAAKVLARGTAMVDRITSMTDGLQLGRDCLLDSGVHALVYGCMQSCVVKTASWEQQAVDQLSTEVVRFSTAGQTMLTALDALGAQSVSIFSPYSDQVAELVPAYFEGAGRVVVANTNRASLADPHLVVGTHPEDLFRAISALPPADALCILATDLPTFQIVDLLEQTWGGPVVSSNLAMLWWLLQAAEVPDALPSLGLLGRLRQREQALV